VHGAVGDAVHVAVVSAIRRGISDTIRRIYYYRLWGQWLASWHARTAYYRDVCGLQLDGDLWDRDRAYAAADTAGWWWPHKQFVMVSDRPVVLHLEQAQPTGWGSHRLHCETGPAIAWADGWALWYWHGTQVPQALIDGRWTTDDILREPNSEIRRCAIERMGWPEFVAAAGLRQVGKTMPDPGNPGHTIALYDVPEQIYDEPVRVLLCTNGTAERDGTRHQFGLTVPASVLTPVAAAAWGYGLNPSQYAQMQRRT